MRVFSRALLIAICLHVLGEGTGQAETCKPAECWDCTTPLANPSSQSYWHNCSDDLKNCTVKDFIVTIHITPTTVDEGMTVTVNCTHNIPNGSISWLKDNELQAEILDEIFQIKHILKKSVVNCNVKSTCGNYNSTFTIEVKAPNNLVVLLICVGAAAGLLILFAVVMKIALKRGQAQSHARKIQRQQNMDNIHSTVNTVTSYY
ncbi:hypothetical protein Q8A67_013444 [Cirrhinus molitorella]|uniref:Ig-like domain-containing protein n=1 Tax=Cirrhinus molitorella TaxID=172907 RepID=A0AA88TLS6_9TELE|nr:hypothetical protein Q8A67_013444 [Cirrhinus molitorella]